MYSSLVSLIPLVIGPTEGRRRFRSPCCLMEQATKFENFQNSHSSYLFFNFYQSIDIHGLRKSNSLENRLMKYKKPPPIHVIINLSKPIE